MPKPQLTMSEPEPAPTQELEYDHPEAQAPAAGQPDEDGMIYHGSRKVCSQSLRLNLLCETEKKWAEMTLALVDQVRNSKNVTAN